MDERRNIIYSRPFLAVVLGVATLLCIVVTLVIAPDDWSLPRTIAAGGFIGAWCFFCVFVNHVLITGPSEKD